VRLIDARVGGEDSKAADVYREMLPAAHHVVKQVRLAEPARCQWCSDVRRRIAGLMGWLGGGALEVEIRRAIVQEMREGGDDPEYATALMCLGNALYSLGRHAEALDLKEQALAFRRRVLPADHPHIASAMNNTANSYSALGRHAEALDLFEQALAFHRRVLPADQPDMAIAIFNLATAQTPPASYWFAL
jgi:tetratricopeptide (TPR) repeat protein